MELGIVTVLTSLVATASSAVHQSSPEASMLSRLAEELLTALA
jgi:hypothetical protein